MTIKINAEITGVELKENFAAQLKTNKIDPNPEKIKFLITNSQGKEVEVSEDKVKMVYSNE